MKLRFAGQYRSTPRILLQKCGYGEQVTRQGKISYTRRLRGADFPRFHAYVDVQDEGFHVNLHLDQKGACYEGTTAHSGEYDGELVEREAKHIAWEILKHKM